MKKPIKNLAANPVAGEADIASAIEKLTRLVGAARKAVPDDPGDPVVVACEAWIKAHVAAGFYFMNKFEPAKSAAGAIFDPARRAAAETDLKPLQHEYDRLNALEDASVHKIVATQATTFLGMQSKAACAHNGKTEFFSELMESACRDLDRLMLSAGIDIGTLGAPVYGGFFDPHRLAGMRGRN